MPTGYTADIVEGKVKTFKDFAKRCIRAFGATIHMRDEPLSKKYEPRKADQYYIDRVEECEEELIKLKNAGDQFFIDKIRSGLNSDYAYYSNRIKEIQEVRARLDSILEEAEKWVPPTEDHVEAKKFMINQLEETIRYDGDADYYVDELEKIKTKLESPIDVLKIRYEMIADAEEELERARERLKEETDRCEDSNKWAEQFLKSIE